MSKHAHYWVSTGVPHPLFLLTPKFLYECAVCDKRKYFREQPINPLVPTAWALYAQQVKMGGAAYVMSPPIGIGQESQWAEGQRYKHLVGESS